jgi:hypothetical protein
MKKIFDWFGALTPKREFVNFGICEFLNLQVGLGDD